MGGRGNTSGAPEPAEGHWPPWYRRLARDLLPSALVPEKDGLTAPEYEPPAWLADPGLNEDDALELAKEVFNSQEERGTRAEEKGAKIAKTSLALLAIAFTAAGFSAGRLAEMDASKWEWMVGLSPASLAVIFLGMAALQGTAIEHRVRLSWGPTLDEIAESSGEQQRRELVGLYDRGQFIAHWSGTKRLDEVLQASAWLTRGIVALIVAGIATVVIWSVQIAGTDTNTPQAPASTAAPTTTAGASAGQSTTSGAPTTSSITSSSTSTTPTTGVGP